MSGTIKVEILQLPHGKGLALPAYQSADAAGLDLLAAVPEETPLILPPGCEAQVRPRSGLAVRHGLTVLNAPGTIDADYRGELQVLLVNHGAESVSISRGMRIAQMVIAAVARAEFHEVTSLDETARGSGGFGSTGS